MNAYKNNTAKSPSLLPKVFGLGQGQEQGQEHVHGQGRGRGHRNGAAAAVVFVLALLLSVSTAVSSVFAQETVFVEEQEEGFATFDPASHNETITGSLNGVGFTITPLDSAKIATANYSNAIPSLGSTPRQFVDHETTSAQFTITFDEPIESLTIYAVYFRNQTIAGNVQGYDRYDFTGLPSIAEEGFTNVTEGPAYLVNTTFTSGVIRFTGSATTFIVKGVDDLTPAPDYPQAFTFSAPPPPAPKFLLADNGITVTCDDAAVGETGVVNIGGSDVTFTKRTAAAITTENAATTCTSGITSMFRKFQNTV